MSARLPLFAVLAMAGTPGCDEARTSPAGCMSFTDRWRVQPKTKVDLLFVVRDAANMAEEQEGLGRERTRETRSMPGTDRPFWTCRSRRALWRRSRGVRRQEGRPRTARVKQGRPPRAGSRGHPAGSWLWATTSPFLGRQKADPLEDIVVASVTGPGAVLPSADGEGASRVQVTRGVPIEACHDEASPAPPCSTRNAAPAPSAWVSRRPPPRLPRR